MNFNGNDVSLFSDNVSFSNVCTDTLTAQEISVGMCGVTPLYELPPIQPPSTMSVMVAEQAGTQVFRIPTSTFKWTIQDTVGHIYPVNVEFKAGDYDLVADVFPAIENEFQVVLAPLTASGDYVCSLVVGHFTLTLSAGVNISQTVMLSSALSDNGLLGSSGNSIIIGNSGSVTVPNLPTLTTIVNPVMQWLPYIGGGGGTVTNPLSENLDAGGFIIKNLGYINLIKSGTPVNPVNPQVSFYSDINGNLASVNSSGVVQTLTQTEISALDATSSVLCSTNKVTYTATTNDFSPSGNITMPANIYAAGPAHNLGINFGVNLLQLNGSSPFVTLFEGATQVLNFNSVNTQMMGPDGSSGFSISPGNCIFNNGTNITGFNTSICQFPNFDYSSAINIGTIQAIGITMGSAPFGITLNGYTNTSDVRANINPVNLFHLGLPADIRLGQIGQTTNIYGLEQYNNNNLNYTNFSSNGNDSFVTGSTAEQLLDNFLVNQYTIPAGSINFGDTYRLVFGGTVSAAVGTVRFRIRGTTGGLTGNIYYDSGIMAFTTGGWKLTIDLLFRVVGGLGVAACNSNSVFNHNMANAAVDFQNTTTVDTTVSNILTATIQFSSAAANVSRRIGYGHKVF